MTIQNLIDFVERVSNRVWVGQWIKDSYTKKWIFLSELRDDKGNLICKVGDKQPMVDLEEMFVEMLSLGQKFLPMQRLDHFTSSLKRRDEFESSSRQMEALWIDLKEVYDQVKLNPNLKYDGCEETDQLCSCGKGVYYSPIFKFDLCFKCLMESRKGQPSRYGSITCRVCHIGPRKTQKRGDKVTMKSYCSYCDSKNALVNYEKRLSIRTGLPCTKCKVNERHITSTGLEKNYCIECRRKALKISNDKRYKRHKEYLQKST